MINFKVHNLEINQLSNSLENIFHANYSLLCNYATAIIKDDHMAEDLVQSVFIQLWENQKILSLENPAPYLLRCVKYKSIDYLRNRKRKLEVFSKELPEMGIQENTQISEEDIEPLLYYFAAKLPPKTRKVFLMSRQERMSYKEIAEELGVSVKTVENQMGTALKKMRTLLKEHHYFSYLLFFI